MNSYDYGVLICLLGVIVATLIAGPLSVANLALSAACYIIITLLLNNI
jgi:hypothetical protein